MSSIQRKFKECPVYQGKDERVAYTATTTPWGGTPSSVEVKIYDEAGTDVSGTKLSGSAAVNGDVITTPLVIGLTAGSRYRLEVKFTTGGNVVEAWGEIVGEE